MEDQARLDGLRDGGRVAQDRAGEGLQAGRDRKVLKRMRYEVEVNGRLAAGRRPARDGRRFCRRRSTVTAGTVDAARIDAHTLSLLIGDMWPAGDSRPGLPGRCASYEVAMSPPIRVRRTAGCSRRQLAGGRHPQRRGAGRRTAGMAAPPRDAAGPQRVVAPMPGKVVRVLVGAGDAVKARQPLVVVEAMKMENELRAGRDGHVTEIHVREGAVGRRRHAADRADR